MLVTSPFAGGYLMTGGSHAATDETAADGRRRYRSHQRAHSTPGGATVDNWRHCVGATMRIKRLRTCDVM